MKFTIAENPKVSVNREYLIELDRSLGNRRQSDVLWGLNGFNLTLVYGTSLAEESQRNPKLLFAG